MPPTHFDWMSHCILDSIWVKLVSSPFSLYFLENLNFDTFFRVSIVSHRDEQRERGDEDHRDCLNMKIAIF